MSYNILIGLGCILIAGIVFVSLLRDVLGYIDRAAAHSYQDGYERGKAAAEMSFIEAGRQVDEARQQIWRDEARQ